MSSTASPAQWTIRLRELRTKALVGVHPSELQHPQPVRVDLALSLTATREPIEDRLESTLDYDRLVSRVRAICADGHVALLETLCEKLAAACFQDRRVRTVWVSVEKLALFPDVDSVSVELERASPFSPPNDSDES